MYNKLSYRLLLADGEDTKPALFKVLTNLYV
jgi:hypothetical protein